MGKLWRGHDRGIRKVKNKKERQVSTSQDKTQVRSGKVRILVGLVQTREDNMFKVIESYIRRYACSFYINFHVI